eukprot:TRINITY_DN18174_c0_g3_i1.p1 TRINITY_DN18174_c0_g3~~TRINITY_DN18174_c0_g3_i1.p1  ORF type:complete len:779 (+),score=200.10 TRINITY_DN18174_c0_g3_i1:34-2337(+)
MTGVTASSGFQMDSEKCMLLLKKCCKMIDTFEPKKATVDAHIDHAPCLRDKKLGDVETKFISQVFYGCTRYQRFLVVFVTSFFYKCPAKALRTERTLYMALAYLVFFRLEDLGIPEFRQFLLCGHGSLPAVLALMEYALNVEELEKWAKVEWCRHYDVEYIEKDIIGKLQSYADELQPLMIEIEYEVTGVIKAAGEVPGLPAKSQKPLTQFKPFNLTRVRPRLIPDPDVVINKEVVANPVPASLYKNTLASIEESKIKSLEEEKARVLEKYDPSDEFVFETAARRDHEREMENLREQVEKQRMAECSFQPKPAKKYVPPTEHAVVVQNASSVLREDALLKQKQARERQILKRYEEDLHDESGYHAWQEKMREKDHNEEEQRVHQRFMEMQMAREHAKGAQEAEFRKRHIMAEHQREELAIELEFNEKTRAVELAEKQKLVDMTMEDRVNARLAEQEVTKAKEENAVKLRKQKASELEKRKAEEEQEFERKKDLVRQIRALENAPIERVNTYDPAEPPCHGLLEEMSLAELRERLKIARAHHEREVDEKRERQLVKKFEKQEELTEKAEVLAKVRERAREEQQQRHDDVRRQRILEEEKQQLHRESAIEEVADRLKQKKKQQRQEELKLKRELKEISMQRQFLAAGAEQVESRRHAEVLGGLDREAQARQRLQLVEQKRRNQIKVSYSQQRLNNIEADVQDYKTMQRQATERVQRAKSAHDLFVDEIKAATRSARNLQKARERRNEATIGHSSNTYIKGLADRMGLSP